MAGARRLSMLVRGGIAIWAIGGLLPALLVALRGAAAGDGAGKEAMLVRLLGRPVAAYLGYAPDALVHYILALLVLSPVLMVTFAVGRRRVAGSPLERSVRTALRASGWWAALAAGGLTLVFAAVSARSGQVVATFGWTARLLFPLLASGLSFAGIATACALLVVSRRGAVAVGMVMAALIGFAGLMARAAGWVWLPATIDRTLLSGRPGLIAPLLVAGWLAVGLAIAALVPGLASRRRQRLPASLGHVAI
jgi:hypothetical protein